MLPGAPEPLVVEETGLFRHETAQEQVRWKSTELLKQESAWRSRKRLR